MQQAPNRPTNRDSDRPARSLETPPDPIRYHRSGEADGARPPVRRPLDCEGPFHVSRTPARRSAAPALPRLRPAAADDAGRPAPGEPDHLPRRRDQRRRGQHGGHEVPVPPVREPDPGHQLLHQQPRRQRHEHAGDLRHDAVHRLPGGDLLHRPGRLGRRGPAGRRHQGAAVRPAALQDHDPPALRPGRRPGLRHRDPGRGDRQEPAGDQRDPRQAHRPADRADRQGHRARPLPDGHPGQGIRPRRRGRRPHPGSEAKADARRCTRAIRRRLEPVASVADRPPDRSTRTTPDRARLEGTIPCH